MKSLIKFTGRTNGIYGNAELSRTSIECEGIDLLDNDKRYWFLFTSSSKLYRQMKKIHSSPGRIEYCSFSDYLRDTKCRVKFIPMTKEFRNSHSMYLI